MAVGGFKITAPPLWLAVALPLCSFTAAVLSISAFGANTPIWVSNALAVTALLRNKRSTWPILLFLAVAADYASNVCTGTPVIGIGFTTCDGFEILLVALLAGSTGIASPIDQIWPMARLALVCLLVPTISATGGATLLASGFGASFSPSWLIWYLATACGLLTTTPLLLSWTDQTFRTDRARYVAGQSIILAMVVGAVGYLQFSVSLPDMFLAFPFLLLATFNGRLLGATTAAATLAAVAIWSTVHGRGPISGITGLDSVAKVEVLQLYLVVVLLSTLPVAAILEQRERLTAQLRESTKAAQSAVRAKSEFLAVMSHEIRTPMTAVLGMADLLINADLPVKERKYVTGIQKSGQHLLSLINDILDFSRIEAGKLDLETIDFSIPEVLEQVLSLLAPQAAELGLELRFELGAPLPPALRGDPTRLKQILVNLAGNGLKFTQSGGVTVAVHQCAAHDNRERFRFEVRDTGIGIPEDKHGILFNVFSQVDSSTTRQYGGSGLGLAICRQLVEAMGGEIGVESTPGVGSCFWFEVPFERGERTTAHTAEPHTFVSGVARRVLLVEDVEMNQLLISDMLRHHGHDVTLAVNGLDAIALAAREHFDVVLMDVQMPVMDGIEATRRIRALPPPAGNVPVLALSANAMVLDLQRYMAAGMTGALTKPIDWPQLFEALAKYGGQDENTEKKAIAAGAGTDLPVSQPDITVRPDIGSPIDLAVFDRLRSLQSNTGDLTSKLTELFIRDVGQRLADLQDALHRADAPAVAQLAHAIKGSAANLGARRMTQICTDIETLAEAAELNTVPARTDDLQHEFARACDTLTTKLTTV